MNFEGARVKKLAETRGTRGLPGGQVRSSGFGRRDWGGGALCVCTHASANGVQGKEYIVSETRADTPDSRPSTPASRRLRVAPRRDGDLNQARAETVSNT